MTDHEQAAMEKAALELHPERGYDAYDKRISFIAGWKAHRVYEPPTVCGERGAGGGLLCVLHAGHDGDHRAESALDGEYIGWPREQEPDTKATPRRMRPCYDRSISSSNHHYDEHDENEVCAQPRYRCQPVNWPDPDELCQYRVFLHTKCDLTREEHYNIDHAFVSAKEATK